MGWAGYIIEGITLFVVALMTIGVIETNYRLVLALLVITIVLDLIFWIINLFRYAPCFTIQTLSTVCDPSGCELIVKGEPCDYATRVNADIRHANDQSHLQTALVAGLFVFLLFGIFIARNGTGAFAPLNPAAGAAVLASLPLFASVRAIQILIVVAYAFGFKHLLDTHSDLMYRHFTAIPEIIMTDGCEKIRYGAQKNTKVGNRRDPLGAF